MRPALLHCPREAASLALLAGRATAESRILDCGSRDGALLRALGRASGARELVALDYHNRTEDGVRFVRHDLEQGLAFPDDSFDVVVCNDVLEHVENKVRLFSELLRVGRRHVLVSLPNTQHWRYIRGLIRGRMSKQYNFLVDDGVDRHRWVTYYGQNETFVSRQVARHEGKRFALVGRVDVTDGRVPSVLARLVRQHLVFNQLFLLEAPAGTEGRAGSGGQEGESPE